MSMVQGQQPSAREKVSPEWVRWLIMAAVAALVSYYTTISTVQQQTMEVKTTEAAHFQEILRRFDTMQTELRDMRNERPQR